MKNNCTSHNRDCKFILVYLGLGCVHDYIKKEGTLTASDWREWLQNDLDCFRDIEPWICDQYANAPWRYRAK